MKSLVTSRLPAGCCSRSSEHFKTCISWHLLKSLIGRWQSARVVSLFFSTQKRPAQNMLGFVMHGVWFFFGHRFLIQWRIKRGTIGGVFLCELTLIHAVNGHMRSEWPYDRHAPLSGVLVQIVFLIHWSKIPAEINDRLVSQARSTYARIGCLQKPGNSAGSRRWLPAGAPNDNQEAKTDAIGKCLRLRFSNASQARSVIGRLRLLPNRRGA